MYSEAATVSEYLSLLSPEERADIQYGNPGTEKWFKSRYKASGKRMDMGKSCVRFRHADDLPLDLIGEAIARTSVDDYIVHYEKSRRGTKSAAKAAKKTTKKKAAKKR